MRRPERIDPVISILRENKHVRDLYVEKSHLTFIRGVESIPISIGDFLSYMDIFDSNVYMPKPKLGALELFKDQLNIDECSVVLLEFLNKPQFIDFWKTNPDMRLGQALINFGYEELGFHWYLEEITFFTEYFPEMAPQILFWGTYGREGKGPLEIISIRDMSTDHLKACIVNVPQMDPLYMRVMKYELNQRLKYRDK